MPIVTRHATSWCDDGRWVDVPAGTPIRFVEDANVALAGDDHRHGLVLGALKSLQAAGVPAVIIRLMGRVRVVPKSAVEVSAK